MKALVCYIHNPFASAWTVGSAERYICLGEALRRIREAYMIVMGFPLTATAASWYPARLSDDVVTVDDAATRNQISERMYSALEDLQACRVLQDARVDLGEVLGEASALEEGLPRVRVTLRLTRTGSGYLQVFLGHPLYIRQVDMSFQLIRPANLE